MDCCLQEGEAVPKKQDTDTLNILLVLKMMSSHC